MDTPHQTAVCVALLAGVLVCSCAAADITWRFADPADIVTHTHFCAGEVAAGCFMGETLWDPCLYLRLPEDGLDVSALPHLTARLFSSADADVLDVYYKCADGLWGLGRTLPIKRGWATYRADLREANWTEGGMQARARQWGGVSKRVISFRLDPGNEANRWVVIDRVSLTAEPTGAPGLEVEPRGRATALSVAAPRESVAGAQIRVSFGCRAEVPEGLRQGTALIRLMSGPTVLQAHQETVELSAKSVEVTHEFPVSAYSFGGRWTITGEVLELDAQEVASAPIIVSNPRTGTARSPVTRVAPHRGEPTLFVEDKPIPVMTFVHHGGSHGALQEEFARTGIKLFTDWFGSSVAGDLGQVEPGVYDYGRFDAYFATVLDAVPDAFFLPHIGVTAPHWWQDLHPEECCLYSDDRRGPSSMASELWKSEMSADLRRLIARLRQAPYADRILGYMFYGGCTAEWQMWATWKPFSDDYSAPALKAFRSWLGRKYDSDAALRTAWRDPDVRVATAQIPSGERRRDEEGPFVRDPATDRQVIDFTEFTSDMVADAIIHFARVTKEACGERQIAGTYYGYMAAHGSRQPDCGHNALARVLACPDVDFLMSPPMYRHRGLGETSTFMSATESIKLHGKLYLDESDLRTYLSDPAAGYGRTDTQDASVAVTWREFANVLTRRCAVSWFDMSGGWFSGEPMLEAFARIREVSEEAFARRKPFHAEVAVFVDERSFPYFRTSRPGLMTVRESIALMPQSGVTWDFYLLSDAAHADLPDYRLYVVLNGVKLDEAARRALVGRAARNDATILYVYAPGCVTESGLDIGQIEWVTGMAVEVGAGSAKYRVDGGAELGADMEIDPRVVITDPDAEALAWFCDGAGVAMARKRHQGVNTVYCASLGLAPSVLRSVARAAGAHVYCGTDDALYTDGQYLALHAAIDGEKTVRLREATRVVDAMTGEIISAETAVIRREMARGETLFVRLGD